MRAISIDAASGRFAALRADAPAGAADHATVLLLPGFTGSKEDFLHLLPAIAERGFAAVAIDQRGQFETAGPEADDDGVYSLASWAADAVAVAEALGGPVHLVGHSFGGLVAQTAALLSPGSFRSLSLLGTGPGALPEDQHADLGTFVAGLPLIGKDAVWTVMRQRAARKRPDTVPGAPDVEEFVRSRFVATTAGSLVAMARLLTSAPDLTDDIAACGVPVQVLHGESDDAWPPAVQRAVAERLAAPYAVVPGAGHSPNVDDPATTAKILTAFFSSAESGASTERG